MESSDVVLLDRGNNTTCTVSLHGATVVSWRVNNQEQLFVSRQAIFDGKKAIRGGVPFIFPQFGPWEAGPQHGFARITGWDIKSPPQVLPSGDIEAVFGLSDSDFTRQYWDYAFHVTYRLILREKELHFIVSVTNPGDVPLSFTILLHTYLKTPDAKLCEISGFKGCTFVDKTIPESPRLREDREVVSISGFTDRIYEDTENEHIVSNVVSGRKMKVVKNNFPDTVIWNPWEEKAKQMADFGDTEYPNMLCVEAGYVAKPVNLSARTAFEASQILQLL